MKPLSAEGWLLLPSVTGKSHSELLDTDLHHIGEKWIPADLPSIPTITGPKIVQIKKLKDVSHTKISSENGSSKSMFRLTLSDGHTTCTAMNLAPLQNLSGKCYPGTKVRLTGNVQVLGGFLLLTPSNCEILGGRVERLVENIEKNEGITKRKGGDGVGGPPKFVPFGSGKAPALVKPVVTRESEEEVPVREEKPRPGKKNQPIGETERRGGKRGRGGESYSRGGRSDRGNRRDTDRSEGSTGNHGEDNRGNYGNRDTEHSSNRGGRDNNSRGRGGDSRGGSRGGSRGSRDSRGGSSRGRGDSRGGRGKRDRGDRPDRGDNDDSRGGRGRRGQDPDLAMYEKPSRDSTTRDRGSRGRRGSYQPPPVQHSKPFKASDMDFPELGGPKPTAPLEPGPAPDDGFAPIFVTPSHPPPSRSAPSYPPEVDEDGFEIHDHLLYDDDGGASSAMAQLNLGGGVSGGYSGSNSASGGGYTGGSASGNYRRQDNNSDSRPERRQESRQSENSYRSRNDGRYNQRYEERSSQRYEQRYEDIQNQGYNEDRRYNNNGGGYQRDRYDRDNRSRGYNNSQSRDSRDYNNSHGKSRGNDRPQQQQYERWNFDRDQRNYDDQFEHDRCWNHVNDPALSGLSGILKTLYYYYYRLLIISFFSFGALVP
eukprot:sb/3462854/